MKKFAITFKKTAAARKVFVWERFAATIEDATASVLRALDAEYPGTAVLVSIVEA